MAFSLPYAIEPTYCPVPARHPKTLPIPANNGGRLRHDAYRKQQAATVLTAQLLPSHLLRCSKVPLTLPAPRPIHRASVATHRAPAFFIGRLSRRISV